MLLIEQSIFFSFPNISNGNLNYHTMSVGRRNNTDASNNDEDMMGSDHEDKDLIGSDHEDNFDHTTMYIEEESNNGKNSEYNLTQHHMSSQ